MFMIGWLCRSEKEDEGNLEKIKFSKRHLSLQKLEKVSIATGLITIAYAILKNYKW